MPQDLPKPGKDDVIAHVGMDLRGFGYARDPNVTARLVQLVEERAELGIKTYGTRLQTFNGRDAKQDLLEEVLDALNYATQLDLESTSTSSVMIKWKLLDLCFVVQEYIQLKSAPVTGAQVG